MFNFFKKRVKRTRGVNEIFSDIVVMEETFSGYKRHRMTTLQSQSEIFYMELQKLIQELGKTNDSLTAMQKNFINTFQKNLLAECSEEFQQKVCEDKQVYGLWFYILNKKSNFDLTFFLRKFKWFFTHPKIDLLKNFKFVILYK